MSISIAVLIHLNQTILGSGQFAVDIQYWSTLKKKKNVYWTSRGQSFETTDWFFFNYPGIHCLVFYKCYIISLLHKNKSFNVLAI